MPLSGGDIVDIEAVVTKMLPKPAAATPKSVALDGAVGDAVDFARADHTHAARVQRTVVTTANDGTFTWTFKRPILCDKGTLPPISYMVEDAGDPVVVQITGRAFTSDGTTDTHTSVTVKAQRSRALPSLLLSLTALLNFNIFGGNPAAVKVNLWAADPTQ